MASGALVISLDFELHWGVRDKYEAHSAYRRNLLGAREAIPRMLELFDEFDIGATWATVGFLFARSREELDACAPQVRPGYLDRRLFPYEEVVGRGEEDDPIHFAPSLIELIRGHPRQEIGTHTFSHYYCLEPGQTRAAFEADLGSAVAIAERAGIRLRSIALPRNQFNPSYADGLVKAGIRCYRGNQTAWMYRPARKGRSGTAARAGRLLDSHAPIAGLHLARWEDVLEPNGLCNVPASLFLRPWAGKHLEPLRRQRIALALRRAARSRRIFHLWWHPHNFGAHTDENLAFLRSILGEFDRLRSRHGMQSLAMGDVADRLEESEVA
jgi:peptidoglycan/xylan/chitin deacetylase (PgdA/CDA1 family)